MTLRQDHESANERPVRRATRPGTPADESVGPAADALHEFCYWAVFEKSRTLALITDPEGAIQRAARGWEVSLGYTGASLVGRSILDLLHPEDRPPLAAGQSLLEVLDGLEVRCLRSDGSYRRLVWSTTVVPAMKHAYSVAQDVTELRRAQRSAEDARARAVAASTIKSRFLADMSHEIRTPMSGALGMLTLALETELSAAQRELLEAAHESADSLLTILNGILDISKVEAGKLSLESIPFSLRSTLDAAVGPLFLRAKHKGLGTRLDVNPSVPDSILGDPTRFRQIVVNLLGNAIKFTAQGAVAVRVEMDAEERSVLHVSVNDSGIGIPAEKLGQIFEPFEQAERSTTRRSGGTGLGLAICRELTALMGGRIWVESVPGYGSSFQFTARLPESKDVAPTPGSAERASGDAIPVAAPGPRVRVLLAEDEPINAKVAKRMLEKLGCDVVHVSDGRAASEVARAERFDLALVDMRMPLLDGVGATEEIRTFERGTGGHLPIFALTANAMNEDVARCLAAGMDGHLAKPLQRSVLVGLLAEHGPRAESSPPPLSRPKSPESVKLRAVRARCGNDRSRLGEVAEAYGDDWRDDIGAIEAACDPWDAAAILRATHHLSETFRRVEAEPAERIVAELERAVKAGDVASTVAGLAALREASGAVEEVLLASTTCPITVMPPAR